MKNWHHKSTLKLLIPLIIFNWELKTVLTIFPTHWLHYLLFCEKLSLHVQLMKCEVMVEKLKSLLKVAFFSESAMKFFQSPNLKKKIFQKTILSLKFKFPANNTLLLLAGNLNFKLRIVLWNIFHEIWRSEKISSHFLKKSHL